MKRIPDIESHYKHQMSKVQNIRSTKYKDFVEFLKGELKQARRILNDPKLRVKYDGERKVEISDKLSEIIVMFIQISGDLSEIEIGEIHRRGKYLNLAKREIDRIIDEELKSLGCRRTKATAEQLHRASEIMNRRADHDSLTETGRLMKQLLVDAQFDPKSVSKKSAARDDDSEPDQLKKEVEKLRKLAERKEKYKPLRITFKIFNTFFNILGWILTIGLVVLLLYLKDTPEVQSTVKKLFNIHGSGEVIVKYRDKKIIVEINSPSSIGKPTKTIENKENEVLVKIEIPAVVKTRLDKIRKLISKAGAADFAAKNLNDARLELIDYYDELGDKIKKIQDGNPEKTELINKRIMVLNYYKNILSPMYYSSLKKWEWKMTEQPLDFVSPAVKFIQTFAEFNSKDNEQYINFGGLFLTGKVVVDGFIFTEKNKGGLGIAFYKNSKTLEGVLELDAKDNILKFNAKDSTTGKMYKVKEEIKGVYEIEDFILELLMKVSRQNRNYLEFIGTFTTITKPDLQTKQVMLYGGKIPFSSLTQGHKLALYLPPNSSIGIRRIVVEPYN